MKLHAVLGGLLFLGGLTALSVPARASYPSGTAYVNADGYWQYPGYANLYWVGNHAFTRYWTPTPGYGYGYGYSPGYWRYTYSYSYAPPAATYSVQGVTTYTPDWRARLLDIAAARDKTELAIRKAAFDQAYFKEGVALLGLQGNFRVDAYGAAAPYPAKVALPGYPGMPNYGNAQAPLPPVNGQTVYGYSLNTIGSVYGDANPALLFQQAYRLAENVQGMAKQGVTDFSSLLSQDLGNRAKIAEWLAKGEAARAFFKGLEGSGAKVEIKANGFQTGPTPPPMPPAVNGKPPAPQPQPQPQGQDGLALWKQSAAKCTECHSGAKLSGKFDVSTFPQMSAEQRLAVIDRLITSDAAKRMPRNADGSPGPKMTANEVALWLQ